MNDRYAPEFSTLRSAIRVGEDAASVGFDWEHAGDALEKVREECSELDEAIEQADAAAIVEELGDLLFAVCNVARKLNADADQALDAATKKFEQRFNLMRQLIASDGLDIGELTLDTMERFWVRAKHSA